MKALVIGATGATGQDLVRVLLDDSNYVQVTIFVRRASGLSHSKLSEIITDFDHLENVSASITGDVWFSCLGTTLKQAGSKTGQWQVDYEIPVKFAEMARKNGISRAVLLSAYGASPTSRIFYSRMKGTLEEKIKSIGFGQYIIFRPGLLLRKDTDRTGERVSGQLLKILNKIGLFKKFRPMPTLTLAEKMAKAPGQLPSGIHLLELDRIFKL